MHARASASPHREAFRLESAPHGRMRGFRGSCASALWGALRAEGRGLSGVARESLPGRPGDTLVRSHASAVVAPRRSTMASGGRRSQGLDLGSEAGALARVASAPVRASGRKAPWGRSATLSFGDRRWSSTAHVLRSCASAVHLMPPHGRDRGSAACASGFGVRLAKRFLRACGHRADWELACRERGQKHRSEQTR